MYLTITSPDTYVQNPAVGLVLSVLGIKYEIPIVSRFGAGKKASEKKQVRTSAELKSKKAKRRNSSSTLLQEGGKVGAAPEER